MKPLKLSDIRLTGLPTVGIVSMSVTLAVIFGAKALADVGYVATNIAGYTIGLPWPVNIT